MHRAPPTPSAARSAPPAGHLLMHRESSFSGRRTLGALVAHGRIGSISVALRRRAGSVRAGVAGGSPPAPEERPPRPRSASTSPTRSPTPPTAVPCRVRCRPPCRVPCRALCCAPRRVVPSRAARVRGGVPSTGDMRSPVGLAGPRRAPRDPPAAGKARPPSPLRRPVGGRAAAVAPSAPTGAPVRLAHRWRDGAGPRDARAKESPHAP